MNPKFLRIAIALVALIFISILYSFSLHSWDYESWRARVNTHVENLTSSKEKNTGEKLAYATLLTSHKKKGEPDPYFEMARVLAYKLLRHPDTKTQIGTPLVVMVSESVDQSHRDQLVKDGCIVKQVNRIDGGDRVPGSERWADIMTKFRAWQLTDYDRVLYMDLDIYPVRNIDSIWNDPATHPIPRVAVPNTPDELPPPDEYILAASDYYDVSKPKTHPILAHEKFNAGFMLIKPDEKMFQRYISILGKNDGRMKTNEMDQDLLNYAHNRSSPVPWSRLGPMFVANFPDMGDYEYGVAGLHDKMWEAGDDQLKEMYYKDVERLPLLEFE